MAITPRPRDGQAGTQREKDLHWLRGWGERVRMRLSSGRRLTEAEPLVFHPCPEAAAALKRLAAEYGTTTYSVEQMHRAVIEAHQRFLASPGDDTRWRLAEAMDALSRHVIETADAIEAADLKNYTRMSKSEAVNVLGKSFKQLKRNAKAGKLRLKEIDGTRDVLVHRDEILEK